MRRKQIKGTQISIYLSAEENAMLERYCKKHSTTKKVTARKILHDFLAENVTMPNDEAENQLDLFSSRETDIFDFVK